MHRQRKACIDRAVNVDGGLSPQAFFIAAGSVPSVVTIYAVTTYAVTTYAVTISSVTISSVIMIVFGCGERWLSIGRRPEGSVCTRSELKYHALNFAC